MKHYLPILAVALTMASCEIDVDSLRSQQVTFHTNALTVDYQPMSRASLSEESMTDLFVWEGETLLCHQKSTDADFGSPSITLTNGEHSLTFVASKSEGQTFTEGQWRCTKVGDTFATVKAATVTASTKDVAVELPRRVGRVTWTISDALPTATNMTIGVTKQCYGLDAALVGVNEGKYTSTVNISQYAGVAGMSVGMMVLPKQTDGVAMSATFRVDQLCDYATSVTIVSNQVCAISGEFFTDPTPKATVTLNSTWGTTTNYDIR